jgi:small subunit ribosomal protein S9
MHVPVLLVMNLNAIRFLLRPLLIRRYSTASPFVPPESLHDVHPTQQSRRNTSKTRPSSSAFYTGRASYYDHLKQIEDAVQTVRHTLTALQLLPLPEFARASLVSLPTVWKDRQEMSPVLGTRLTNARYRRATSLLSQLNDYRCIAVTASCSDLADHIENILDLFERENKAAVLARGKRKPVKFDVYGRTYTVGRRKTSSARVWVIRSQTHGQHEKQTEDVEEGVKPSKDITHSTTTATSLPPTGDSTSTTSSSEKPTSSHDNDAIQSLIEILHSSVPPSPTATTSPSTKSSSDKPLSITPSTIIINNAPLSSYFLLPADRERVVRPLKVAGVLGGFNIFALVRGGGTSGQSGAVALGIAKALAAHEPAVENVLRKGESKCHLFLLSHSLWMICSEAVETRSKDGGAEEDRFGKIEEESMFHTFL